MWLRLMTWPDVHLWASHCLELALKKWTQNGLAKKMAYLLREIS